MSLNWVLPNNLVGVERAGLGLRHYPVLCCDEMGNPIEIDADFAWLTDHSTELFRKFAGKWIAVHKGEVIGVGDTATEAAEQARAKAGDAQFILEALDSDADVIYAGL